MLRVLLSLRRQTDLLLGHLKFLFRHPERSGWRRMWEGCDALVLCADEEATAHMPADMSQPRLGFLGG